jgi:ABC-type phosphate transport system substrate-binding protein
MKTLFSKLLVCVGVAMLGAIGTQAQDKADQLVIIVNPANPLNDISTTDLQRYFKAEKTKAPDGIKIVIVMMDVGRPERDAALKHIYQMSEEEYNDYFVSQTFTGAVASAPKSFRSASYVKRYVAENRGAIGYIRASDADDSVKVLKVNGKAPGDADYKLGMK